MGVRLSLIVGMYHYVRAASGPEPSVLHFEDADAFERQVARWAREGRVATFEEALLALSSPPEHDGPPRILLTFDDGLAEHYAVVSRILTRHGAVGAFFLPTAAIEERQMVDAHRTHLLMAALGPTRYREVARDALRTIAPESLRDVDAEAVARTYRWDDAETASFKYLVNYVLAAEARESLSRALFREHLGDERACAERLYLTWEQAESMQSSGMLIGGHSHTHPVLSSLDAENQRREISTCAELLSARLGRRPRAFAYPFGKQSTFDDDTIAALREHGFCAGFTTERTAPATFSPFRIARVDAKDLREV